jgi:hypothetical protein
MKLDSNLTDGIILEVLLLPPHCWTTAVADADVAGALFSD